MLLIWTLAALVVSHILYRKSTFGRKVLATGGNRIAARYSGINTDRIRIGALVACSLAAALAGILYAGRLHGARYTIGEADLLTVIAAAVIGGTNLMGGRGSIVGALMGSLLMGVLNNGLILMHLSVSEQMIARGMIIVIAVAGFFLGPEAARGEIVAQLQGLLGNDGAAAIQALLESASKPEEGLLATITSVLLLLLGATTIFAELQSDLDRIWRAETKPISGLWALLRARILSFGMILVLAFLLLVSLVVSAALSALGKWWGGWFEGWAVLLEALNFVVSFAITTGLFALLYKFLPRADIAWHDVWIGAAVTALLFAVGKFLIGLYIGRSGVAS